jgi:membrane protein required for colicin V production
MLTALDVGVGVLVLISAILATARGLTREVLSLATWAGSAAVAIYAYLHHKDLARQYISESIVADGVTVGVTFLITLIILHLITMRIADFVVDSKIGPLDRTLGFVFGAARGVLIAVVVVIFGTWLLGAAGSRADEQALPSWARNSRSLPMLNGLGYQLIGLLPADLEQQISDFLKGSIRGGDETPADEGTDAPEDDSPLPPAPATSI